MNHVIIIGGSGAVGTMLAGALRETSQYIGCIDVRPPAANAVFDEYHEGDAQALAHRAKAVVRDADCVIVATPLTTGIVVAKSTIPLLAPGVLFVDTFSVKGTIAALVNEVGRDCEHLSINPMFAPALGLAGQNVAVIADTTRAKTRMFLTALDHAGARVVMMSAPEHDQLAARVQAATHFCLLSLGMALQASDPAFARSLEASSPVFRICLSLIARIVFGKSETYWEIQSHNAYASDARGSFLEEAQRLHLSISAGDAVEFERALLALQKLLRADSGKLVALSDRVLGDASFG